MNAPKLEVNATFLKRDVNHARRKRAPFSTATQIDAEACVTTRNRKVI